MEYKNYDYGFIRRRHRRRLKGHPLRVRHKQDWGREFILLLPQDAVLPGLDAGSDGVKSALGIVIQSRRPRASCGVDVWGMLLGHGLRLVQGGCTRNLIYACIGYCHPKPSNLVLHVMPKVWGTLLGRCLGTPHPQFGEKRGHRFVQGAAVTI